MTLPAHLTPEIWLQQLFTSKDALAGGVIKRQICDVDRLVGRDMFFAQARLRGCRVWENGRHFIVVCNHDPITRHV